MSRYSGKCDFCDFIDSYDDEYVKKSKFYIYEKDGTTKQLEIKTMKDCIPYFSHIVGSAASSKECGTIFLTRHSWLRLERSRYGILAGHYYYRQKINELMQENGFEPMFEKEECEKDFWTKFDVCGHLYLIATIFKDYKNDLHICKDDENNLYLARTMDKANGEYIITPINKKSLLDMVESKFTIEESIKKEPISYVTHYDIEQDSLVGKKRNSCKMGKQYFKRANFYCKDKCDEKILNIIKEICS